MTREFGAGLQRQSQLSLGALSSLKTLLPCQLRDLLLFFLQLFLFLSSTLADSCGALRTEARSQIGSISSSSLALLSSAELILPIQLIKKTLKGNLYFMGIDNFT